MSARRNRRGFPGGSVSARDHWVFRAVTRLNPAGLRGIFMGTTRLHVGLPGALKEDHAMSLALADSEAQPVVTRYAETNLPTQRGNLRMVVFRDRAGAEHVAMVAGDVRGEEVLVRVHSECMTSEVFGSLKCDCRSQLDRALDLISWAGRGVVLYLRQEGRGIGLGNKVRAYALQERGHDTVDANRLLGLPDDTRSYVEAAAMLKDLGVESVALLTNNPLKVEGVQNAGMPVVRRVEHLVNVPQQARGYMDAKRTRMGHMLGEMGAPPVAHWDDAALAK